jgi:RHH-type proline utilization regulon transcriptional repressor/proline dehydrogenase/delta 1-pyrroline-5-carboxylate dehydrogenase
MRELVPRVWLLCERAGRAGINLTIDAEECERLEVSLDVLEALMTRAANELPGWAGLGLAVQAYQTRALHALRHVIDLADKRVRLMVRLVKGAYWDAEVKRAQILGVQGYPVFTHKHHTDLSYLACARTLLEAGRAVYPQFATHNAATVAAILELGRDSGTPFELQRLHGMGESVYREVLSNVSVPCRIYAPVGQYRDLLAYLVRRLLENGANASFVHQLADDRVSVSELVRSPLHVAPRPALPLPGDVYGQARRNSAGIDITVRPDRARLLEAYALVTLPRVVDRTADDVPHIVAALYDGFAGWSSRSVHERVTILRNAADVLEARTPLFAARLVREGRKTWDDAVSEVREAVDFLRYYALEAERVMAPLTLAGPTGESNELRLRGRGVWVCISPWNFPLAIFTGQVGAALVTGNCVAAKPAEQTPAIAAALIELLHEAGVPRNALTLCAGAGGTVGAALVADPRIAEERRALVPLIAETGGINAMIVDTTALPEQVVDAVIVSAFRSAGQRCSALRLLCLHDAIADATLGMLQGAVAELAIGDPADPATDVGPVIDSAAKAGLDRQIAALDRRGRLLARVELPRALKGDYVAPCIYAIDAVEAAREEIFGPVLQVVRWDGDVEALVSRINALGFGLTLGVQTRVDGRAERIAACARVGNVYVNRSMIGAVVGVQPFGGEGLSGTGPKAGGPHYLARFCVEQTISTNTAAAGGNVALLGATNDSASQ